MLLDPSPLVAAAPPTLRAAVSGARAASSVGAAFLAGYRAAVHAATGVEDGAIAATEDGPVHPARIATVVREGRVTGAKTFVTGVPGARRVVVLATAGRDGDRAVLQAVVVELDAAGVEITPRPPLPFVPEVGHASVRFEGAPGRALPGDGWADVVRPFRTIEDIHVSAAFAAYLFAHAEAAAVDADHPGAVIAAMAGLAAADPARPEVHLALHAALEALTATAESATFPGDPARLADWRRDLALLRVASWARKARREAALAALRGA